MIKFLKTEKAICRAPSADLDNRILLAARIAADRNRSRRHFHRIFAASSAAAALLIGGAVFVAMPSFRNAATEEELLAMNDWSKFEQESYNLSFQISSEGEMLPDLADEQNI